LNKEGRGGHVGTSHSFDQSYYILWICDM